MACARKVASVDMRARPSDEGAPEVVNPRTLAAGFGKMLVAFHRWAGLRFRTAGVLSQSPLRKSAKNVFVVSEVRVGRRSLPTDPGLQHAPTSPAPEVQKCVVAECCCSLSPWRCRLYSRPRLVRSQDGSPRQEVADQSRRPPLDYLVRRLVCARPQTANTA